MKFITSPLPLILVQAIIFTLFVGLSHSECLSDLPWSELGKEASMQNLSKTQQQGRQPTEMAPCCSKTSVEILNKAVNKFQLKFLSKHQVGICSICLQNIRLVMSEMMCASNQHEFLKISQSGIIQVTVSGETSNRFLDSCKLSLDRPQSTSLTLLKGLMRSLEKVIHQQIDLFVEKDGLKLSFQKCSQNTCSCANCEAACIPASDYSGCWLGILIFVHLLTVTSFLYLANKR